MSEATTRPGVFDLIGADLRRVSGHEYAGPCPFCGGTDRFRVRTDRDRWMCRRGEDPRCAPAVKWHDAIDYVRARDGVDYRTACGSLGLSVKAGRAGRLAGRGYTRPPEIEPSDEWRRAAQEIVARASRLLTFSQDIARRTDAGDRLLARTSMSREALSYLHGRGLSDETIQRWQLGYTEWRLSDRVAIPGPVIVIPWFVAGVLWQVKLRLLRPKRNGPRYLPLTWIDPARRIKNPAGQTHLFGADTLQERETVILVEGELDAILLFQELGDLCGVATLGCCTADLPRRGAHCLLRDGETRFRRLILAYDADEAGREGARRLQARYSGLRIALAEVPRGKDVGEFHASGGDVRVWGRAVLATHAAI